MRERRIWLLGRSAEAPEEFPWDRGLRYGMSLFETIAARAGRPLFAGAHLDRLEQAARETLGCETANFCAEAARILAAELPACDGVARVYLTAGAGAPCDACTAPGGFVAFESCEVFWGPGDGIVLALPPSVYFPPPGGWKTGNYWSNIRAMAEARTVGCDEAVLCGPGGQVVSCAFGNLFVAVGGQLLTPSAEAGARRGVVREWVMKTSGAREAPLIPTDLAGADEIFVTNSRVGIASVSRCAGRRLPSRRFAEALAAVYRHARLEG